MSDSHTIDVGYVHVLNDDRTCRDSCPHPDHDPERRAAARGDGDQAGEA